MIICSVWSYICNMLCMYLGRIIIILYCFVSLKSIYLWVEDEAFASACLFLRTVKYKSLSDLNAFVVGIMCKSPFLESQTGKPEKTWQECWSVGDTGRNDFHCFCQPRAGNVVFLLSGSTNQITKQPKWANGRAACRYLCFVLRLR